MATLVDSDWKVKQYSSGVLHLAQLKGAVTPGLVSQRGKVVGDRVYFSRMSPAAATVKTTSGGDTPVGPELGSRRAGALITYEYGSPLIDDTDVLENIHDPASEYQLAGGYAFQRAKDDIVIAAINGSAYSGVAGATAVVLPSAQKVAAASTGLTLAKLIAAKQLIMEADVDPDVPMALLLAPEQVSDLLNTTEVKSADYNEVKALVAGKIDTFMGFKFVQTTRLNVDSASARLCLAFQRDAVGLFMQREVKTKILHRVDKSDAKQVYATMKMGATRIEDTGVVEIACVEA